MRLDHADARPHDPREFVHGDPGGERVRSERRAQVVETRGLGDPRRGDCRTPFAISEVATSNGPRLGPAKT